MSAELPVAPGQLVAGKYRVDRVLGQGGMGIVVGAVHEQLQQRVAIKFLLAEVASNPEAVARFTREARAAVRIQSEHVARVIDVGALDNGAPYMVMEHLEGRDLAELLVQERTLSLEQVVTFVLQAGEALSEAHLSGIVHRDLKPSNLFITRRADGSPCVKLLDFGISKTTAPSSSEAALTKTTGFLGSPLYVSPEQILSTRDSDVRADIWALGVILYEALAGRTPFQGETVMEIAARILQQPPPRLHQVRPDLSPTFCDVVMKCLEKNRDSRFQDMAQLARALGPFAPGAGISVERISRILSGSPAFAPTLASPAPAVAVAVPEGGSTDDGHATSASSSIRLPRRRPRALFIGLAVAAVGLVGLLRFASRQPSTTAAVPPPTAAAANTAPQPTIADSVVVLNAVDPAVPMPSAPRPVAPPRATAAVPPVPPKVVEAALAPSASAVIAPLPAPRRNPLAVELK
jgi:serine/threonine protein kinase